MLIKKIDCIPDKENQVFSFRQGHRPLVIKLKSCPGSLAIMPRWNFDFGFLRKINMSSRLNLRPVAGNSKIQILTRWENQVLSK
jgi:hypothetical protein